MPAIQARCFDMGVRTYIKRGSDERGATMLEYMLLT
jgi:hypothetical protein